MVCQRLQSVEAELQGRSFPSWSLGTRATTAVAENAIIVATSTVVVIPPEVRLL